MFWCIRWGTSDFFGVGLCALRVDCLLRGDTLFDSRASWHCFGKELLPMLGFSKMERPNSLQLKTIYAESDGHCAAEHAMQENVASRAVSSCFGIIAFGFALKEQCELQFCRGASGEMVQRQITFCLVGVFAQGC